MSIEQLEAILQSDQHYQATPSRNYGERDPLEATSDLMLACTCGAPLVMLEGRTIQATVRHQPLPRDRESSAYQAICARCGRADAPSLRHWRAVVDWNFRSAKMFRAPLAEFPFFNLAGLSDDQCVERLNCIKYDLMLRRALAKRQREAGKDVGGRFLARLDAYLGWINVGLRVAVLRGRADGRDSGAASSQAGAV